ncbi:MAG: O-antigen ligase family protein [Gammaproteobacteria bacterium]
MTVATMHAGAVMRPYSRLVLGFLGLTLATSSIVFIEPAPYDVLVIGMLVGMLITGLRFPREMKTAAILLGLFAVGNMIAAAVSADPLTTLRSLSVRVYMTLAWCLFVGLIVANPERILRTIWLGYLAAAILAVTWAMLEYFGFINFGDWQAGLRAKGPFKDPNVFAPFLIPAAVYALNRVLNGHGLGEKILNSAVFGFLAFGVLLSFSRGAWLNFVIACGLFSLLTAASLPTHRDRLRWLLVNAIMILAVVALLGFATSTKSIADRFMQRAVLTQKYDVAQGGRFFTQKQAIQKIATTPLGVGPGRSDEEFGLEPHNLYLHVFVEGGWLAGAGFLLFVALSLYRSLALFRWDSTLLGDFHVVFACTIGMLTQSLFIDSTHWRHSWLLFAMLWGLIIARQRAKSVA